MAHLSTRNCKRVSGHEPPSALTDPQPGKSHTMTSPKSAHMEHCTSALSGSTPSPAHTSPSLPPTDDTSAELRRLRRAARELLATSSSQLPSSRSRFTAAGTRPARCALAPPSAGPSAAASVPPALLSLCCALRGSSVELGPVSCVSATSISPIQRVRPQAEPGRVGKRGLQEVVQFESLRANASPLQRLPRQNPCHPNCKKRHETLPPRS